LVQGEIGQGGYGAVSKALDKLTGDMVAVKFVIIDYFHYVEQES
jgi:serine/threonine protein kinase